MDVPRDWIPLGRVPQSDLSEARLQAHWAVQIVASFGQALLPPRPDDSQSNLGWDEEGCALCSHPSEKGFSVGLRLNDLTLQLFDSTKTCLEEYALNGQTLTEGFQWLTQAYTQQVGQPFTRPFTLREYEMPIHPVGKQTPFAINDREVFRELQDWFRNAHALLRAVVAPWLQASPVRCWPHHFDIASLVTLDPGLPSEKARSVGCGMSPGDGLYPEPYFYITPWPYPAKEGLPGLSEGGWHTEGFVGAILTASNLKNAQPGRAQPERVRQFFSEGTKAAFEVLNAVPHTKDSSKS